MRINVIVIYMIFFYYYYFFIQDRILLQPSLSVYVCEALSWRLDMSFRLFILSKCHTKVRHQLNLTYHEKKNVGSMRINVIVIYMIQLFNILVIFLLQESFFKMRARLVHCNDYYMRIRISITRNTLSYNVISITIHQFGDHLRIESRICIHNLVENKKKCN